MAGQLRYELIGDASQFRSAAKQAASASEQLDTSIQEINTSVRELTDGQTQLRDEQGRFVSSAREAANATEVQAAALQELNSEGIETTQQIREQIDRLEQLEAIYGDDARAAADLRNQQERLRNELIEVGAATVQQERDLSRLDQQFGQATVEMTDFAARQSMLQQELRSTAAAQDRVSSSGVTMRSSVSAAANNLGFEFAQAAQDARFGMAGVANQIPLMTEQFQQLTARAGSTSAAFSALGRSLLGPAGIILAVTQLIQLGPQLSSWFSDAGESAEETDEAFQGFFQTVDAGLPNIDRLRDRMEQLAGTQGPLQAALAGTWEGLRQGRQALGGTPPLIRLAADAWDEYADAAERVTGERPGENVGELLFGVDTQQLEERTRRLRSTLQGTGTEAQLVRSVLNDMGADIETVVSGSFEEATQEVRQFRAALQNITQAPEEALTGRPGALADFFRQRFQRVSDQQRTLVEAGVQDRQESLQQQRRFLEEALRTAALQLSDEAFQREFEGLISFYESLGGELGDLQQNADDAGDEGQEAAEAYNGLGVRLHEAAENARFLNQVLEGQDLTPMQRQIQQLSQFDMPTMGEIMLQSGQSTGGLMFESAQDAGLIPEFQGFEDVFGVNGNQIMADLRSQLNAATRADELGLSEMGNQMGQSLAQSAREALVQGDISETEFENLQQDAEQAGVEWEEAGESRNQQLAQSIQMAAQLGTTMVQAAQQGQVEWNQLLGSILTTIGGIVGTANPVAGASIAGSGQLVGSFQHGGRVDTPFQWVGERGPELAALPQGTQVYDHETSMRMAEAAAGRGQSVNVQVTGDIQRVGPGELGVVLREVERYQQKHPAR